ncbi:hypothetical protein E1B28_003310 [Marasmius oreades]|uniref:Uncharacterized protein n=1 Tax=Marasmius oreades TaxID=181124 RepID=A0A9P7RLB8_9AGAR|nr:uncharacterized protein E1B28_003310 [Marasmius oreades]KAG7085769.1 hypothetical protein E1B28_003310 [Marasmius oreades]
MVYRVPTQLESFVPPPASQPPNPVISGGPVQPWRGSFIVSGMRASDVGNNQEIKINAVESDGLTPPRYSELWPTSLIFSITTPNAVPIYGQLQNYLNTHSNSIPRATFLPDKLRDPNGNMVNQNKFRALSRHLWDKQLVAVVMFPLPSQRPSPPHSPPIPPGRGAGLLIFPVATSTAILLGAVFVSEPFPDFVYSSQNLSTFHPMNAADGSSHPSRGRELSIPISPTVIQSHSRQQQQHIHPHSFSSNVSHAQSPHSHPRHAPYDPSDTFRQSISPTSSSEGYESRFSPQVYRSTPELEGSNNVNISSFNRHTSHPYTGPNSHAPSSSSNHHTQTTFPPAGNTTSPSQWSRTAENNTRTLQYPQ